MGRAAGEQADLFPRRLQLPAGLVYRPDFLDPAEERALVAAIAGLPLEEARYKAFTARRRIASFGSSYDFDTNRLGPAPPVPALLHPLRDAIAAWAGIPARDFAHVLVAEYRPGTQLGWHRDVPQFDVVAGVSLGAPARMRLRPHAARPPRTRALVLVLAPRSAYVLRGEARWRWQHAISPTKGLRYSITFRTMR